MTLTLTIGNKNYSSWSMRAWVLMRALGIEFEERLLMMDFAPDSPFRQAVAAISPAGKVPVLQLDDGLAVWDTLAIAEALNDRFPDRGVWPASLAERARARSLCAEMHAGFTALRQACPMNIEASLPEVGERLWQDNQALRADVARLEAMWGEALGASGGPMLFDRFGAVDAFYAPVCMRLRTYGLPLSEAARAYVERVYQHPAVAQWVAGALSEQCFLAEDEPYRSQR